MAAANHTGCFHGMWYPLRNRTVNIHIHFALHSMDAMRSYVKEVTRYVMEATFGIYSLATYSLAHACLLKCMAATDAKPFRLHFLSLLSNEQ